MLSQGYTPQTAYCCTVMGLVWSNAFAYIAAAYLSPKNPSSGLESQLEKAIWMCFEKFWMHH